MHTVVDLMVSRKLILGLAMVLCMTCPVHAQVVMWSAPGMTMPPDDWKKPFVEYRLLLRGSVAARDWRYVFNANQFAKLRRLSTSDCSTAQGPCPVRVALTISTIGQRDEIRRSLVQGEEPIVSFLVGTLTTLHPQGWGFELMELLLSNHPAAKDIKVQQQQLGVLLTIGGEIVYEERLTSKGQWFLTRSLYYRTRVGAEQRQCPLWVSTLPAEIE